MKSPKTLPRYKRNQKISFGLDGIFLLLLLFLLLWHFAFCSNVFNDNSLLISDKRCLKELKRIVFFRKRFRRVRTWKKVSQVYIQSRKLTKDMKVIHPRFSLFLSRRNHVPCDLNKSTPQDRFSLLLLILNCPRNSSLSCVSRELRKTANYCTRSRSLHTGAKTKLFPKFLSVSFFLNAGYSSPWWSLSKSHPRAAYVASVSERSWNESKNAHNNSIRNA